MIPQHREEDALERSGRLIGHADLERARVGGVGELAQLGGDVVVDSALGIPQLRAKVAGRLLDGLPDRIQGDRHAGVAGSADVLDLPAVAICGGCCGAVLRPAQEPIPGPYEGGLGKRLLAIIPSALHRLHRARPAIGIEAHGVGVGRALDVERLAVEGDVGPFRHRGGRDARTRLEVRRGVPLGQRARISLVFIELGNHERVEGPPLDTRQNDLLERVIVAHEAVVHELGVPAEVDDLEVVIVQVHELKVGKHREVDLGKAVIEDLYELELGVMREINARKAVVAQIHRKQLGIAGKVDLLDIVALEVDERQVGEQLDARDIADAEPLGKDAGYRLPLLAGEDAVSAGAAEVRGVEHPGTEGRIGEGRGIDDDIAFGERDGGILLCSRCRAGRRRRGISIGRRGVIGWRGATRGRFGRCGRLPFRRAAFGGRGRPVGRSAGRRHLGAFRLGRGPVLGKGVRCLQSVELGRAHNGRGHSYRKRECRGYGRAQLGEMLIHGSFSLRNDPIIAIVKLSIIGKPRHLIINTL